MNGYDETLSIFTEAEILQNMMINLLVCIPLLDAFLSNVNIAFHQVWMIVVCGLHYHSTGMKHWYLMPNKSGGVLLMAGVGWIHAC